MPPIGLLAELSHRCPLRCPYCSNPTELVRRSDELSTEEWLRVLDEASALGVVQVHLSGGEPTVRADLQEIVRKCAALGLYSNLITSGIGLSQTALAALVDRGLDHVQLSFQGATPEIADPIAGMPGAFESKRALAQRVVEIGVPLTVNAVIHRANIGEVGALIGLAVTLGAKRVEIAHAQYHGWALSNRAALMPALSEVLAAIAEVERLREDLDGTIVIDSVLPDYYARYPKACMGGWGRRSLNVTPKGDVLPCHAAESIHGMAFWNVRDRPLAEIWSRSPAFAAFRGVEWMREPCRSCDRREIDWGGCRCQALALAGDATQADPACHKSPYHAQLETIAAREATATAPAYRYRGYAAS